MIELFGGYPRSHLDLLGVGEVLTGQSLPTEHSPPRLLQVEPGRAFGDEHLLYPRMSRQPLLNRGTLVAGEVVGDEVDLSGGIGLLDRLEQSEVAIGVSGGSGERQRLAVFDPRATAAMSWVRIRVASSDWCASRMVVSVTSTRVSARIQAAKASGPSSSRQITGESSGGSV